MASDNDNGAPPIEIPTESLEFEHVKREKTVKSSLGRRLLMISILAAAVAGAAAWWIFDGQYSTMFAGSDDGQVPTVRAEISPVKVKPENPGGMDVPNQDKLVYERLGQKPTEERVERLLPEAEKPMPKPQPQAESKPQSEPQPEPSLAAKPIKGEPAQVASGNEPPKPPAIPTEKVIAENIAPVKPAAEQQVSAMPTEKDVAAVQAPKPAEVKQPEVPKPAPAVKAAPAPAPKPKPLVATPDFSKSYQVQLAAVRSTASAKAEWARMQKKFPGELSKLSLNIVKADLGKKGIFYRLRAGPVPNAATAQAICSALKAKKAGCLIVRPGK